MRRSLIAIGLLALLLTALPAGAGTSATIISATAPAGRITVSWSLPAGEESDWVEVARAPSTVPSGSFEPANYVDSDFFTSSEGGTTTWASDDIVPSGTYYVHVETMNWSDITSSWSPAVTVNVTETKLAPELSSLARVGQRLKASWALAAGVQVSTIEVAKNSAVDSDGSFSDTVDFDFLADDTSTSWTSDPLKPGTYYVHVSGHNANCSLCPYGSWSTVQTIKIKDLVPPIVRARASRGMAGKKTRLVYHAFDSAGKVKVTLEVFRKGRRLAHLQIRYAKYSDYSDYYVKWKAPRKDGLLRLCASGIDQAGNKSKRSCARLRIKAQRRDSVSGTGKSGSSGGTPGDIYNCADFPLPDGTTAQEYLYRYPSDPSNLDGDNDGLACESS